jgi:TPR repeat protein
MDQFRSLLRDFILAEGDGRIQYRIKDDAFDKFNQGTSNARDLVDRVNASEECPPTNYTNSLELYPDAIPRPPAPAPAAVRLSPDQTDRRCSELAGSPIDRDKVGNGVPSNRIIVSEALPVCQQAAARQPVRARYQHLYGRVLVAAKRYDEAAALFTAADRAGYALGSYYLASLYEAGLGRPRDVGEATRLYQRAGASIPDAFARLGELYISEAEANVRRPDVQQRAFSQAAELLQRAADRGATTGFANLGWLYEFGRGVPQDRTRAARLYDEAAKRGDILGMYRLGLLYWDGVAGAQRNFAMACQLFRQAAQDGFAYAQGQLGNCYYSGNGMPQDHQAAFGWFLRAAEGGVARAQEFVGDMYKYGDGVAQSDVKAVEWYRAAAIQNDPYGMFQLGAHLRIGSGVTSNEPEAMQWFQKAAAMGEIESMVGLGMGYLNGLGGGLRDYALAARWFGEAARHRPITPDQVVSVGFAQLNLAGLYESGLGVTQNLDQARLLYTQAAGSSSQFVAQEARKYLAAMLPRRGPAVRDPMPSSNLLPTLIVGGLAILALSWMHSGSSDASEPASNFDWSPQKGPYETEMDIWRQAQRSACAATLTWPCS